MASKDIKKASLREAFQFNQLSLPAVRLVGFTRRLCGGSKILSLRYEVPNAAKIPACSACGERTCLERSRMDLCLICFEF